MRLVRKLNNFLARRIGIRFERVIPASVLPPLREDPESLIVEFMGASGVGKTTLRDYYLKTYKNELNTNVLTESDLKKYKIDLQQVDPAKLTFYNHLFGKKLMRMGAKNDSLGRNEHRFKLFLHTLLEDCKIRFFLPEKTVFMDQHVFKFFTEDFMGLEDAEAKRHFLKNRIIVYCFASPFTVVDYIKKRAQTGKVRIGHQDKDEKELREAVKDHLGAREKEVKTLRGYGAKLIEIDTGKSLVENAKTLHQFIQKHI